jgi:hypothetical protein
MGCDPMPRFGTRDAHGKGGGGLLNLLYELLR